jgi:hypothetical protein
VPDFDPALALLFGFRAFVAFVVWQAIYVGCATRHQMRLSGWSRTRVRLTTAGMWTFVVGEVAAFITGNQVLFAALMVVSLVAFLPSERIIAAIRTRPDPRIALVREVTRIYGELGTIEGPDDRARIDEDLAALDRWVEPATFEFIQLARSRVLTWFDGGPRVEQREARWSSRMNEIVAEWFPPGQPDWLRTSGDALRRLVLRHAKWLVFLCGAMLGASVYFGRSPVLAVPLVAFGWIATWATERVVWVALVGAAAGLAMGTAVVVVESGGPPLQPWIVTVAVIEIAVLLAAGVEARSARRKAVRPSLRLVSEADTEST